LAGVGLLAAFIGASRTPLSLPPGTGQSGYSGDTRPNYWNAADGFPFIVVTVRCSNARRLKARVFDTETAIKSTGLGLTHARAPVVSPWRAFNPLETEG
jgi:hypothetical protein